MILLIILPSILIRCRMLDKFDHVGGFVAAEHVGAARLGADEEAVGGFAVVAGVFADVAFPENSPIAEVAA